jgi:ubiquinone/menaquinone biosynthesis C-methylase UbiE
MRAAKRPRGFAGRRWDLLGHVQGRTLEIGCGSGYNFEHYPKGAGTKVTAFDPDPERLRSAARLRAPIRLARADAEQMAWPSRSFDSVVGTLVFCSIPNPAQALAEARRVLRPGGRLYLLEHVRSHHAWLGQAQDWLAPAWRWGTGGCNLNRDTEATLRAAGFEIETLQLGYYGLLKLMIAKPRMV